MKKALIIGAAGFVGKYLADHIQKNCGWDVCVTKMAQEHVDMADVTVFDLDILNREATAELLGRITPDYVFHLAAQSSVAVSWREPDLTVDVNIKGAMHVLDGIRRTGRRPRVLLVGSCEEYGQVRPEEVPIRESAVPRPANPYAVTKACQNMIGKLYADAYGMDIVSVRSFNHIGPDQTPVFVAADFCKQVAEIEVGQRDAVIKTGNLSARRDFTDVRDVVRAYVLLMKCGQSGETYNVGSGEAVPVSELLNKILSMSRREIRVETDLSRLRPVDVPVIAADTAKLYECCGWKKEISLDTTLAEMLDYWRQKLSVQE